MGRLITKRGLIGTIEVAHIGWEIIVLDPYCLIHGDVRLSVNGHEVSTEDEGRS